MVTSVANRIASLMSARPWHEPSSMEQLARLAREQGRFVYDLADAIPRGVPVRASQSGDYGDYPDSRGTRELRRRIAERENAKYGLRLTEDHVVVTNGATEALSLLVHAFVRPGDPVLVQAPGIFLYRDIIENHGARARPLEHSPASSRAPGEVAPLYIIHNPSNPQGTMLDEASLHALTEEASASGSLLVLDQVYDELLDGVQRVPEDQHAIESGRIMKINSVSKSFAAPGLRLGWIVCHQDLASSLSGVAERLRLGVSTVSQHEAVGLLRQPLDFLAPSMTARRALVRAWLETCTSFEMASPAAGLFFWLHLRDRVASASELCQRAWEEESVWLLPGESFWGGGDRHVRLSFGGEPAMLAEALRRLTRVLDGYERSP